tara:strand:+ start:3821 stop:6589 length:2769 start_codon:yes stop_codon:yes gene_type:complete
MSIFKETLRDHVFTQLKIREAIIKQGNNLYTKNPRFGKPTVKILKKDKSEKEISLPAGSFITNTTHRQCTIRMASGVDVTSSKLFSKTEEQGKRLAQNFILQGGTLRTGWNARGSSGIAPREVFRGGKAGDAYGDAKIRSNASTDHDGDGMGIVPMPGIIDVTVETRTAYGSLRTAKVNFVCHNRRQLEVLEILYMRPGMPILLEWGWMPFINNKGKRITKFPFVSDGSIFWNEDSDQNKIQSEVRKKQIDSGGNYDGFFGFCKNFEMVARPDGGYNCTTEIIAAGEVLEGLKASQSGDQVRIETENKNVDSLEFLLEGFLELGDWQKGNVANLTNEDYDVDETFLGIGTNSQEDYDERFDPNTADIFTLNALVKKLTEVNKSFYFPNTSGGGLSDAEMTAIEKNYTSPYKSGYTEGFDAAQKLTRQLSELRSSTYNNNVSGTISQYFQFKGEPMGAQTPVGEEIKSNYTYIRWDFLCLMINQFVIPQTKEGSSASPLMKLQYQDNVEVPDGSGGYKNEQRYLNFARYKLPNGTKYNKFRSIDASAYSNPRTKSSSQITSINTEEVLNGSYDPTVCLFPTQTRRYRNLVAPPTDKITENSIGLIHFNVDYLKRKYIEMAYNSKGEIQEDFGLYDWIEAIWKDVNAATICEHNFILTTQQDFPNNVRIIDLTVTPNSMSNLTIDDLYEFKIQSANSIVRDFNYNTTIPSGISATIAVAAQAPSSVTDLDQVTFANFTKGIKSRFTKVTEASSTPAQDQNLIDKYDKDFERIKELVHDCFYQKFRIQHQDIPNPYADSVKSFYTNQISNAKSLKTQIQSLVNRVPSGLNKGKREPIIPSPRSAVIPLKFNAKMDGVSGIIIGNVFRVDKNRLPVGYQSNDIAFVVMTESQTITSGQDWTTSISGQLILLDLKESERKKYLTDIA